MLDKEKLTQGVTATIEYRLKTYFNRGERKDIMIAVEAALNEVWRYCRRPRHCVDCGKLVVETEPIVSTALMEEIEAACATVAFRARKERHLLELREETREIQEAIKQVTPLSEFHVPREERTNGSPEVG